MSAAALLATTSCESSLDFAPVDYYGSEGYWQTPTHVESYAIGLHQSFRGVAFGTTTMFGELRSGIYRQDVSADGNSVYYNGVISNALSETSPQVTKFYNYYGCITNCNLMLSKLATIDFMTEDEKAPYYALSYGLRAYYYFMLHRAYGGVPIRLGVEVIEGERDINELYMARDLASKVLAQVKADIALSLEYFGNDYSFDPYGWGSDKAYWSRAATEALAADVYLWSGKTTTPWTCPTTGEDGTAYANPSDLDIAKTHFNNLLNNYGFSLQPTQADIFNTSKKNNSEIIYTFRYIEGESTNNNYNYLYNMSTGSTQFKYDEDGNTWGDYLSLNSSTSNWYEYDSTLWKAYDPTDLRRDENFVVSYDAEVVDNKPVLNAEAKLTKIWGTHCKKNLGYMNSSGNQIYCGDIPVYRLAWVYLGLAEIANYQGDYDAVETNMNIIRDRAYGVGVNDFVASDFATNELAIFYERMFEFVQEGHTWWDLRRMTSTKDGDPLVFDAAAAVKGHAVLNKSTQEYMLLWPIDKDLMATDPTLLQTPGY